MHTHHGPSTLTAILVVATMTQRVTNAPIMELVSVYAVQDVQEVAEYDDGGDYGGDYGGDDGGGDW
jgi:hypothetical protein